MNKVNNKQIILTHCIDHNMFEKYHCLVHYLNPNCDVTCPTNTNLLGW